MAEWVSVPPRPAEAPAAPAPCRPPTRRPPLDQTILRPSWKERQIWQITNCFLERACIMAKRHLCPQTGNFILLLLRPPFPLPFTGRPLACFSWSHAVSSLCPHSNINCACKLISALMIYALFAESCRNSFNFGLDNAWHMTAIGEWQIFPLPISFGLRHVTLKPELAWPFCFSLCIVVLKKTW